MMPSKPEPAPTGVAVIREPRLTIVVASRTGLAESRPILEWLQGQTIAAALEVIVVAPHGLVSKEAIGEFDKFESLRLVELERIDQRGVAAAHGLLRARAPFAGLCENHAFPAAGTLEKLISDRDPRDAAVAPAIRTANPETRRSLAMYLAAYGHAAVPADPAPRTSLPYHNGVFRTEVLRELGDRLPDLMRDEALLHAELLRLGWQLRIRPDAVTWHVNESRWSRVVTDSFILGTKFGVSRGRASTTLQRVGYALAVPAILVLRLRSLVRMARRSEDTRTRVGWLLPMLVLNATFGALGEAWGGLRINTPVPPDWELHEFHMRGRLAGVPPASPWLRDIVARMPADLA